MNDLKALESMGLVLPSAGYILGAILFGIIGYMAYRRGKTTKQPNLLWTGVALMLYPYAVSKTWMLWVIGFGLCGWAFTKWDDTGHGTVGVIDYCPPSNVTWTPHVNFWEKLINDPECGPRTASPLERAALGVGFLFFDLYTLVTGSIRISKAGDGVYIHFADHPKTFALTIIGATLVSVWGLTNARTRYLMHTK